MRIDDAGAVTQLPDTLNDVKFSSTGWTPDDKARARRALIGQPKPMLCRQHTRARTRLLFSVRLWAPRLSSSGRAAWRAPGGTRTAPGCRRGLRQRARPAGRPAGSRR
jgi:hypothetical protein